MILVTGGTGFVGKYLIRHLIESGMPVRTLIRPSGKTPDLPKGVSIDIAVSSLKDEKGLESAMKGIEYIIHLASDERKGLRADLAGVDIEGTAVLARVAAKSKVKRMVFLSHLGADRMSAFTLLKAKAIAENHIINSGLAYTIFRSAIIFGPQDQFTIPLTRAMKMTPFLIPIPGEGNMHLQPIWIEDLIACLVWAIKGNVPEDESNIFNIGGPEFIDLKTVVQTLKQVTGIRKGILSIPPAYIRLLIIWLNQTFPGFPISAFFMDYLAADRTCALDTLPRTFGIIPEQFHNQLFYIEPK
ncbi:MAG: NAD(P)H-binding protein [Anaerolineaceae bacterium]|nr:NAD(P)H-binding protein [Anaerolineaceae bacterium]